MFALHTILASCESRYAAHSDNVTVVNEKGELCAKVAWWSDDPVADAIEEAKTTVHYYANYGVHVVRIVLRDGQEIWRSEL